jgi:hypothetical protein
MSSPNPALATFMMKSLVKSVCAATAEVRRIRRAALRNNNRAVSRVSIVLRISGRLAAAPPRLPGHERSPLCRYRASPGNEPGGK